MALFLPQQNVPYEVTLRFEPAALVFSLVTACATTLVFGLLPALHGAKRDLVRGLKEGARGSASLTGRGWVRRSLVIAEGASAASPVAGILGREPAPLPALQLMTPLALGRLVQQCLAKPPDDWPDTAHDVASEFRRLMATSQARVALVTLPK